jgi:SAM-dependent methyltransferase
MVQLQSALVDLHHRVVHVPRVRRVVDALAEQIGQASSLLDVGCGDGTVARDLAARVSASRVIGVDVLVRPSAAIDVKAYDGERLPFEDGAFEAVVLADVLHHCASPLRVLREALRVASRVVVVKDHLRFGPLSDRLLWLMDVVGNAGPGVRVRGTYLSPVEWVTLIREASGRLTGLNWPLVIHDLPFRLITRSELQFVARVEPTAIARGRA